MFTPGDHPRLRGEHDLVQGITAAGAGSPPPTRGTLALTERTLSFFRITPAYAGNTPFSTILC